MISGNVLLDIKYIFLNFLQALFSEDPVYTWDADVRNTKIIIADRHSIDIGVAVKRPSIILQRGEMGWIYLVRGQDATNAVTFNDKSIQSLVYPENVSNPANVKAYTDLLRGYIVFNVVSKNGVQAEIIADKLFKSLTGYKDELRRAGIRQINNLTVSQEQVIRNNSEIELVGVQVSLGFVQQLVVIKDEKNYNCYTYIDETEIFENHDYTVIDNGTKIKLREATDKIVTLDYRDALTLESKTGIELIQTDDPLIYLIPDCGAVAGYYLLTSDIILQ